MKFCFPPRQLSRTRGNRSSTVYLIDNKKLIEIVTKVISLFWDFYRGLNSKFGMNLVQRKEKQRIGLET